MYVRYGRRYVSTHCSCRVFRQTIRMKMRIKLQKCHSFNWRNDVIFNDTKTKSLNDRWSPNLDLQCPTDQIYIRIPCWAKVLLVWKYASVTCCTWYSMVGKPSTKYGVENTCSMRVDDIEPKKRFMYDFNLWPKWCIHLMKRVLKSINSQPFESWFFVCVSPYPMSSSRLPIVYLLNYSVLFCSLSMRYKYKAKNYQIKIEIHSRKGFACKSEDSTDFILHQL